jgi:hypothetical protein
MDDDKVNKKKKKKTKSISSRDKSNIEALCCYI